MQFADDVDKATGGKLKITVHSNASLFKAPEIKRAVQGAQAQAGEILLVNFENENPLFGVDGVPFLATSYADSMKLYKASRPALEKLLAALKIFCVQVCWEIFKRWTSNFANIGTAFLRLIPGFMARRIPILVIGHRAEEPAANIRMR